MSHNSEKEYNRDEIRKEFQLERMVVFSDAVFAIVITLMAIEIRLPESAGHMTEEMFWEGLKHILPTVLAYMVSFFFIGAIWYRHLQVFSLLKDYDKKLVIRNLTFLFFIGLFPFSASMVTRMRDGFQAPLYIYLGIIILCLIMQLRLQHYILIERPDLRLNTNTDHEVEELKRSRRSLIIMSAAFTLVILTSLLITDTALKPLSTLWLAFAPVFLRRKKNRTLK